MALICPDEGAPAFGPIGARLERLRRGRGWLVFRCWRGFHWHVTIGPDHRLERTPRP